MARETLDFRRLGISPRLRLLMPAFSLPCAPPSVTLGLQRTRNALLPPLRSSGNSNNQNLKLQINLKSQNIQISNGLIGSSSFGILNLGIWCLFGTWKLGFVISDATHRSVFSVPCLSPGIFSARDL